MRVTIAAMPACTTHAGTLALLAGALLFGACASLPAQDASAPTPAPLTSTLTPAPTDTSAPPPATATPRPTGTLPPSPTPIASLTPLPPPFQYVFPLRATIPFSDGDQGHGYPAIDLFAPVGTKFQAVTDGVVDFVSYTDRWDPKKPDPALRGGLSVAIVGNDGVRYYGAHLSAIAKGIVVGLHVKMGQLLGYVGTSGDAEGKEAHLHFGISRPTYPEDWHARRGQVDPYPYLMDWLNGIEQTPSLP